MVKLKKLISKNGVILYVYKLRIFSGYFFLEKIQNKVKKFEVILNLYISSGIRVYFIIIIKLNYQIKVHGYY